jgi:hypothetical protein
MDSNDDARAGDGLRELAQMIVRDNVTSATLLDYLRFLLEDQLIEPDALARRWARTVPSAFSDSTPADLSLILRKMANELDATPKAE